jgi:bifunctional N-acetylglucosamine-1-phosphate-uridyltransferase/glucosamine-1-phosphate-acetyltransferase GlmU-like protein
VSRNLEILHDDGREICIVGNSYVNQLAYNCLKTRRSVKLMSFEQAQQQSEFFFQDHQFFSTSSTMSFKKNMIEWLQSKNVSFISLVDDSTIIDNYTDIGYNTVILNHNTIFPQTTIGNHCHLVNYITLVHNSVISDFCYVCGYSYLCFTHLGTGVVVGMRSSFVPKPPVQLSIPAWTNFLLNSTINQPIATAGTYFGNRKISDETSLTYNIF